MLSKKERVFNRLGWADRAQIMNCARTRGKDICLRWDRKEVYTGLERTKEAAFKSGRSIWGSWHAKLSGTWFATSMIIPCEPSGSSCAVKTLGQSSDGLLGI